MTSFAEGDWVVSETAAEIDPDSPQTRCGQYNLDPRRKGFGYGLDGAMARYVKVPARCLHRLPAGVPAEVAALTEPCCVAYQAVVVNARVRPGDVSPDRRGQSQSNIHSWLESEGAQVLPAPVAVWLDYWMRWYVQGFEDYVGIDRYTRAKMAAVKALQSVFHQTYNRLRKALGDLPAELPDQYELRRTGCAVPPQPPVRR